MNTPNKYDRAVETIKNMTGDNSTIAIAETPSPNNQSESKSATMIADLENTNNQTDTNSAIMIAELQAYTTTADMPENLRKALPDIEELKKLL